mgnify:CR=1 FL=1
MVHTAFELGHLLGVSVGGLLLELGERVLPIGGLGHRPALVLESELHRSADALIVLHGQDAGSHPFILPHRVSPRGTGGRGAASPQA